MNRIETTVEKIRREIGDFYDPTLHHFIVMNAVDLGGQIEVQWFFCDYAFPCTVTEFFARISPETEIPGIRDIVPSAWVAEAELADLMDINIENCSKGFVLEPDFKTAPLRKSK